MENKLVKIHRVTKVVKGGRIFSYVASSIFGNKTNLIGFGRGKSREVIDSIKKSYLRSKTNVIKLKILNGKIPFNVFCKHCSTKIYLKSTNIIIGLVANKYVKDVLIFSGIKSIFSKIHGSTNTINVIICTIKALSLFKL